MSRPLGIRPYGTLECWRSFTRWLIQRTATTLTSWTKWKNANDWRAWLLEISLQTKTMPASLRLEFLRSLRVTHCHPRRTLTFAMHCCNCSRRRFRIPKLSRSNVTILWSMVSVVLSWRTWNLWMKKWGTAVRSFSWHWSHRMASWTRHNKFLRPSGRMSTCPGHCRFYMAMSCCRNLAVWWPSLLGTTRPSMNFGSWKPLCVGNLISRWHCTSLTRCPCRIHLCSNLLKLSGNWSKFAGVAVTSFLANKMPWNCWHAIWATIRV